MKLRDFVAFKRDIFFNGAVQVGWMETDVQKAKLATENFIFHGKELHAVTTSDVGQSQLTDSTSFFHEMIRTICTADENYPFSLAVAGYGAGKSHLAVTLALLLSNFPSPESEAILKNLAHVSEEISDQIRDLLVKAKFPMLVVALDGMDNSNLALMLLNKIRSQLQARNLDLAPIESLSQRFETAKEFVRRNFNSRIGEFQDFFGTTVEDSDILESLSARDEATFLKVNEVYEQANGHKVPVVGQESPQHLIKTVCEHYCGKQGPFSGLVILFDEFGRFLEFAADQPQVAGDSALQQIYQGVQDNAAKCHFLGLIQYELKTYLNRVDRKDSILNRYVSRYDSARSFFLSCNLETIIAHLIDHRNPEQIQKMLAVVNLHGLQKILAEAFPSFSQFDVWSKYSLFEKIIGKGCWPLHPTTVWFLARLTNVVQNRSAISFIAAEIEKVGATDFSEDKPFFIYPADLCLGNQMLEEILAAEKYHHGNFAESFASILEKYKARLSDEHMRTLAAVLAAAKIGVKKLPQGKTNDLLTHLSGLARLELEKAVKDLSREFGVLEWNDDLQQYEFITNAVPRSQFNNFINQRLKPYDDDRLRELFQVQVKEWGRLETEDTDFADDMDISTPEWIFKISSATAKNAKLVVTDAVSGWKNAIDPDAPRGQLLYYYVPQDADLTKEKNLLQTQINSSCSSVAPMVPPLFAVVIYDSDRLLGEAMATIHLLEKALTVDDRSMYKQFIDDALSSAKDKLIECLSRAVKEREYIFPAGLAVPKESLRKTGTQIFAAIYPKAIPFVFDGFGTVRGNASRDCAGMTKAIAIGKIDADWFKSQHNVQTKNRATQLLERTWMVLTDQQSIAPTPKYKPLAEIMQKFEAELRAKGTLNLGEVFASLISPPFGFNAASAGLVISLFLFNGNARKSICYQEKNVPLKSWIEEDAFPAKGNFLEMSNLKKTTVELLTEDVSAAWGRILDNWEQENNYRKKLKFAKEAEDLNNRAVVPAEHADRLRFLMNNAVEIQGKLRYFRSSVDQIKDELEMYKIKEQDLKSLFFVVRKLLELFRQVVEIENGRWSAEDEQEVVILIKYSKEELRSKFPNWLRHQVCNDPRQIGDLQKRLSFAGEIAEKLGLAAFKQDAEQWFQKINQQIDKRLTYATSLDRARQFLSTVIPQDSMPAKQLDDLCKEGAAIESTLVEIRQQLQAPDVEAIINELSKMLQSIRELQRKQRKRLSDLTGRTLESLGEIRNTIDELQAIRRIFSEQTDDLDYISELQNELLAYQSDLELLAATEMTPEELTIKSNVLLAARQSACEETGMGTNWDTQSTYAQVLQSLLDKLKEKGETFLSTSLPANNNYEDLKLSSVDAFLSRLESIPTFLNTEQVQRCSDCKNALQIRRTKLCEKLSDDWLASFPDVKEIDSLDIGRCESVIEKISSQPTYLAESHRNKIRTLKESVEERLDRLDYNSLIERIRRLPVTKRKQLLLELQALVTEA